jgi:hypothetical protein
MHFFVGSMEKFSHTFELLDVSALLASWIFPTFSRLMGYIHFALIFPFLYNTFMDHCVSTGHTRKIREYHSLITSIPSPTFFSPFILSFHPTSIPFFPTLGNIFTDSRDQNMDMTRDHFSVYHGYQLYETFLNFCTLNFSVFCFTYVDVLISDRLKVDPSTSLKSEVDLKPPCPDLALDFLTSIMPCPTTFK